MNEFPPPRQRGLVIHIVLAIVLGSVSVLALWLTFQTPVGLLFAAYVLLFFATAIPTPILAYRAYALARANYLLDRNSLRLMWGLRVEDIPVTDVEWIRPVAGLLAPINLPWLRLPGSILGVTRQPDIGRVEFLASEAGTLLLVATARQIFAISPENPAAFAAAFQKITEMGSLQPAQGLSQYPSFVVVRAWDSLVVRFTWLAGIFLNIGLLVWVSTLISTVKRVPLGFAPNGLPLEAVAAAQLILLPFLSILIFITGWLAGLFFYRKPELQVLALAVWVSSTLTALLFLIALFALITAPI
jgi:hypothetical protein